MIALALIQLFVAQGAVPGARTLSVTKDNAASHFRIRVAKAGLVTMRFSEPLQAGGAGLSNGEIFSVQEASAEQLNLSSKANRAGDRATMTVITKGGLRLIFDLSCVEPAQDADAFIDVQINLR